MVCDRSEQAMARALVLNMSKDIWLLQALQITTSKIF
jgi:hypothetical protein